MHAHPDERSRDQPGNYLVRQSVRATPADDPADRPEADRPPRTIPPDAAIGSITGPTGFCVSHSRNPTGGHVRSASLSGWHQSLESSQCAPLPERRGDSTPEYGDAIWLWNVGNAPVRSERTRCPGATSRATMTARVRKGY